MSPPNKTADSSESAASVAQTPLSKSVFRAVLLTAVAGCTEVTAYLDCDQLYAAIMTGNTVQLGIHFATGHWVKFMLVGYVIGLFFFTCIIASLIRRHLAQPFMELVITSGLLMLASVVRLDPALNMVVEMPLLSLALAMQGETISRFGGVSLQTLSTTNNIVRFSDAFAGRFISRRYLEKTGGEIPSLAEVLLPGLAWLTYGISAAFSAVAYQASRFSLLIPAALVVWAAADFQREAKRIRKNRPPRQENDKPEKPSH